MPMPDALTAALQRAAARETEMEAPNKDDPPWRVLFLDFVNAVERLNTAREAVKEAEAEFLRMALYARRLLDLKKPEGP